MIYLVSCLDASGNIAHTVLVYASDRSEAERQGARKLHELGYDLDCCKRVEADED